MAPKGGHSNFEGFVLRPEAIKYNDFNIFEFFEFIFTKY